MIVRLLIWNVSESKTSIDELRESLPELEGPSRWVWNDVAERFGVMVFGEDIPETVGWAQDSPWNRTRRLRRVRLVARRIRVRLSRIPIAQIPEGARFAGATSRSLGRVLRVVQDAVGPRVELVALLDGERAEWCADVLLDRNTLEGKKALERGLTWKTFNEGS